MTSYNLSKNLIYRHHSKNQNQKLKAINKLAEIFKVFTTTEEFSSSIEAPKMNPTPKKNAREQSTMTKNTTKYPRLSKIIPIAPTQYLRVSQIVPTTKSLIVPNIFTPYLDPRTTCLYSTENNHTNTGRLKILSTAPKLFL